MKKLLIASVLFLGTSGYLLAQKAAPQNWFNMDMKSDKFPGVSSNKAYSELLKDKKGKTIIVAVIDGGTEVKHEDLKDVIWVNPKEIAGNGQDDDNNGYVDDVNGWSFIGGKDSNVVEDTYEVTRVYSALRSKYEDQDSSRVPASKKGEYYMFLEAKKIYTEKLGESTKMFEVMKGFNDAIQRMIKQAGTDKPTVEQVKAFQPVNPIEILAQKNMEILSKKKIPLTVVTSQLKDAMDHYEKEIKYYCNPEFNPRPIVGDNYEDLTQRFYGSNYVSGPKGDHGTHVAGIIAAERNNNIGIDGIANNVKIMVLRVVPDGDERDKDVANAIRYAADNGASIINMSFGKSISPNKNVVDEAVRYAVSKDVLLIHAAGNDAKNSDAENNFPRDTYSDGSGVAASWIEVGASSWQKGKNIAAPFSNYGKQNVDLFAPGVDIYSTIPFSSYASFDGTSMASPVTAGVAAMVRSYYPQLSAVQVKDILMRSAVPVKGKVIIPGEKKKKIKMAELCQTGGIVNAYTALKMAEEVSSGKK